MFPVLLLLIIPAVMCHRPVLTFGRPSQGFLEGNFDVQQGCVVTIVKMTNLSAPPHQLTDQYIYWAGWWRPPSSDAYTYSEEKYMTYSTIMQKIDHFGNLSGTWNQRYQLNTKFNRNGGLVFLMLGGEGSISPPGDKWVRNENVSMMQWAAEYGAAAFQLEHRFYGPKENTPFGDQKTSSLQYLTIDQALADIQEFITQMNRLYFSGQNVRWVTFGGSYPGTLSAFFRSTYPEMTIGAVSSSSAVNVFVDYYGYAVNTENNYRKENTRCADNIGTGFKNMVDTLYSGVTGRYAMVQKFNLCKKFDESNISKSIQYFFSNVYGVFQGINQYSGDARNNATLSGLGVPKACQIMSDNSIGDEVARIKAVWDFYNSWNGNPSCNDNDYTGFLNTYADTSYPNDDVVATRSWIWQTCTELGYFQTTDGGNGGIFGSTVPLDFYVDQCIALFGPQYNLDTTFSLVAAVKAKYTPDKYKGTNVVFPNGSLDPWVSLGNQNSNTPNNVDAFIIQGTAHCADMYPAVSNDTQFLINGRKRIHDNLNSWIAATTQTNSKTALSVTPLLLIVAAIKATMF